ncbi:hypothetical protein FEM08_03090 [Flavobacterium gilvum]|nr:hypothetical protein FEM08_03090 [Flavobacterium gilvum]
MVFGQTPAIGDYQSAPSTATTPGAWTSLSSWLYYNGPATGWLTPTAAQGYPGEKDNGIDEAVTILAGHTIRIGDGSGANFSSQPMGKITIIGKLYLAGNINNPIPRFELDAQWVYVEPNVGLIEFNNKVNLWLISSLYPGTGVFTVNKDESIGYKSIIGDCSNNQDINFGPDATSYCAGKKFTFDDLMTSGGSLNAAIGSIAAVCQGSSVSLSGSYTGLVGTPAVYGWHIVDSFGNTQDFIGKNVSFPNAIGTSYTIKLTVSTVYNVTPFTNSETVTVAVNAPPTAPVATAGTALSCTSVRANWQAVSGATSYVLDVATNSGFTSMVSTVNVGNVLSKDITGLTSGTTYYYRVRAFNGTCNSPNSNVITVVAPSVPAAPANFNYGAIRCTQVDLSWNAVTGANTYTVESSTDSGFSLGNTVAVTGLTSTSYTVKNLTKGTNYYFKVTAVNSCSSTNSATIGAVLTLNTPVQPTNVESNTVLCAQFNVTWTEASGAVDYTVEVSTDPAFPSAGLKSFEHVLASPYTVTGLSPSKVYYYRVIAVNGCGSGDPVNGPDYITTIASEPSVPNLEAPIVGCNQLTVNWTASPLAVDYTVELATNPGFPSGLISTVPNITGTSHTFTNLSPGATYYYRVSARNGCGSSAYGTPNPASLTTGTVATTPTISWKSSTISGSTTNICQTDMITSSASSGILWSTGETTQSITPPVSGNYTVQVVNPGGCSSAVSQPATVVVQGLPTAVAGGSETICSNTSATISSASASNGTIQWTASGGAGTLINRTTITPIYRPLLGGPAETVLLTMTVTGINGCSSVVATASHTVNVLGDAPTATAGGSQNICVGGSATVSGASATNDSAISWTHNGAGTLTNETTLAPTYTSAVADAGLPITLTMTVTGSPSCNPPYEVTAIYTVFVNPLTTLISALQSAPVCDSSAATINLTGLLANSTSTINYAINSVAQTAVAGVVADGFGNASFNTGALSFANNGQTLTITGITNTSVTPNCSASSPQSVTLSVLPSLPASVSIAASPSAVICAGTSVTFTATPTNEGTTPVYQWQLNGANVGTNSVTYTNSTLVDGGIVTCVMTSNATPCLTGSPATSNIITMTVNPNLPASVTITASPSGAICAGTPVTFTAMPTNGGITPVYQWRLNGTDVGTNSATYNNSGLVNGDVVTCVMTSNAVCTTGTPATSNSLTIIVNDKPTIASISTPAALCEGTSLNAPTPTVNNNGTILTVFGWELETNASGIFASLSLPYTVALADNGKNLRYTARNSCGMTSSNPVVVTVNAKPEEPIATPTQPTCLVSTGTITVTSPLGSGLSYSINGIDYSNTSGIFNNVAAGSYYVKAQNSSGCISLDSNQVLLNAIKTTTWNGSGWDNGVPNDGIKRVIFSGNAIITAQISACSCVISPNVNVVVGVPGGVNADAIVKLENGLDVQGNGTLTFENNASLIQVNEAVNTGKIIYKRISTPMKNFDFTYWCSPVEDQVLYDLSPNTLWDKYYSFNAGNWVIEPVSNTMNPAGKGFAIRVPKPPFWDDPNAPTYAQPVQFVGVPYNGNKTIKAQGLNMDNLIGNPYPSAIDAKKFMEDNSTLISGALQFWTHNTAVTPSGAFFVYDDGDYALFNLTGGAKATTGGKIPDGKIAAGQAFFVTSNSGSDFVFTNAMRNTPIVLPSGSNSTFFRMSQTKKMTTIEENRVWLDLTNSGGAFKQLLVGYIAGATNEFDNLYDALSMDSNTYVDFYSINNGNNLSIQGRALPFENTDEIPLGYRSTIQGNFTIGIEKTDGVLVNQDIFIEDKVTATITNLKNGPYTFSTTSGVFNNRFVLKFTAGSISKMSTKVTADTVDKTVLVSVKDKQININSLEDVIDKVMIYDLKASLLYEKENVNSNVFSVSNFNSAEQFLIVQVLLKNGQWVTKEIIF